MTETGKGLLVYIPVVKPKEYLEYIKRRVRFLKYAKEHDLTTNGIAHEEVLKRIRSLFAKKLRIN